MTQNDVKSWDIFCKVIDNYGDIGVCWRLARQLANEYPTKVRLWVDEIAALIHIWPSASNHDRQTLDKVEVCVWDESFSEAIQPADVVVEAFACNLPDSYLAAMKRKSLQPYWFNLEYLSAEDWVEGCHGLFSPHPQLGLKKLFFFPGFTLKTGGLIKERSLIEERDAFLTDPAQPTAFLQSLNVHAQPDDLIVSLFGYENNAVASLIETWASSSKPVLCLVPNSKILVSVNLHIKRDLNVGDEFKLGSLHLIIIPFVTQIEYDKLLWSCDINFIRGEDSFVRAQWAAKPFVWQIYPQDDDAHIIKLDAFLARYLIGLIPELQTVVSSLWRQWNSAGGCDQDWNRCVEELSNWQLHSREWSSKLDSQPDLASNLISYTR